MNQQELHNRYLQHQPQQHNHYPPPNNPMLQYERTEPERPGTSLFWIVFWIFVLAGLLVSAFWFGYFAPLVQRLRAQIARLSKPAEPVELTYEVMKETEETEQPENPVPDINDRFADINESYGLLDASQMIGRNKNGHSFGIGGTKDQDSENQQQQEDKP